MVGGLSHGFLRLNGVTAVRPRFGPFECARRVHMIWGDEGR
jgi:hypothetical protein